MTSTSSRGLIEMALNDRVITIILRLEFTINTVSVGDAGKFPGIREEAQNDVLGRGIYHSS
jgi:hypothetical protein